MLKLLAFFGVGTLAYYAGRQQSVMVPPPLGMPPAPTYTPAEQAIAGIFGGLAGAGRGLAETGVFGPASQQAGGYFRIFEDVTRRGR